MTVRQGLEQRRPPQALFPKSVLLAYGLLIGATLAGVFVFRPEPSSTGGTAAVAIVETRALRFVDQPDGSIIVRQFVDDKPAGMIAAGEDGFVRSTLRGLNRERKRFGADMAAPLELVRRADGSLVLNDPATHVSVDLGAFGPSNVASFAAFMKPATASPGNGARAEDGSVSGSST